MSHLEREYVTIKATENIYWKQLEPGQLQILASVMRTHKTRESIKSMIVDELKYATQHEDEVGMFDYEWMYVIDRLNEKLLAKRIKNRDEIEHLVKVLTTFIKKEIKR